jgi:hypothetical protein
LVIAYFYFPYVGLYSNCYPVSTNIRYDVTWKCVEEATQADRTYSETRHKTLEEIAAGFGDKVVEVGDREVEAEGNVLEEKAGTRHVEKTEKV